MKQKIHTIVRLKDYLLKKDAFVGRVLTVGSRWEGGLVRIKRLGKILWNT